MPLATNQGESVKLDEVQSKAIEETKSRLMNFEAEISIANKNLKVIKGETEKAINDRTYQEGLLSGINEKLSAEEKRLAVLFQSNMQAAESLTALNQQIAKKTDILNAMEMEFKKREDSVSLKETILTTLEASVSLREEDVKKSEELLQDKHAKIKAFVETI